MSCAELSPAGTRAGTAASGLCAAALIGTLAIAAGNATAADLGDIVAVPQARQTAEQARRDRYECHNWSVEQTGSVPLRGPDAEAAARARRAERIGKVVTGAAIGAAAGGFIRGVRDHHDAGEGAAAGAVLGAIAGAVVGGRETGDDPDEVFDEYFRALDACMSARGYSLEITETQS